MLQMTFMTSTELKHNIKDGKNPHQTGGEVVFVPHAGQGRKTAQSKYINKP